MNREELLKIAKPVLFNTEMVQAILEGRKTVTRRCVKFPANRFVEGVPNPNKLSVMEIKSDKVNFHQEPFFCISVKPPFKVGDYLYVRETWTNWSCSECEDYECEKCIGPVAYLYKADGEIEGMKWKPSIHMPKEAARIFLKVTDVRVERLQDITEEQALAEGVPEDYPMNEVYCPECHGEGLVGALSSNLGFMEVDCHYCDTATKRFSNLWNSTIKKADIDKYGWDANPWVWVIEFERVEV